MRRREFVVLSTNSVAGVLVYSLDWRLTRRSVLTKLPQTLRVPLRFFTQSEALAVAAAASRIFPTDESGSGANEAGVVIYIDRQLAGPWGRDRYRYTEPPFEQDVGLEFGYQGKATPREIYREGLRRLQAFDELLPAEQDQKLREIEDTRFFNLLRRNTIEGMFCDPLHGGNVDMVGWRLIGFPGPQMSWQADIDKHFGETFRPAPMSLSQIFPGRKLRGSEDEESKV
jgi:gluconate 2-dehydrogenase gamma chain